jgi:hypothetical protein
MTRKKFKLFFVLILFSNPALALDSLNCGHMDLNTAEPLKSMPILDQDGSGTCYAETAAQLLEYELNPVDGYGKIKLPLKTVSAIDLGFHSKLLSENKNDVKIAGGNTEKTIQEALKKGVSSRECIDALIKQRTKDQNMTEEEFVASLDQIYAKQATDAEITNPKHPVSPCQINETLALLSQNSLLYETPVAILKNLLNPCEGTRAPLTCLSCAPSHYKTAGLSSPVKISELLNQLLSQGKPAEVSLCAEILEGKLNHHYTLKPDQTLSDCGHHSVLAVGRRMNKNKCEYLVRNSWGGAWMGEGLTCACKTKSHYYEDCHDLAILQSNAEDVKMRAAKSHVHFQEALDKFNAIDAEYSSAVKVGCWVDSESMMANTYNVGGFTQ